MIANQAKSAGVFLARKGLFIPVCQAAHLKVGVSRYVHADAQQSKCSVIGVGDTTWASRAHMSSHEFPNGMYALKRAAYFKHHDPLLLQMDDINALVKGKKTLAEDDEMIRSVRHECHAAATQCGLLDFSSLTRFVLQGDGVAASLQHLCTNDVAGPAIPLGKIVFTYISDEQGGIIGSMTITKMSEDQFMVMAYAGTSQRDWDFFRSKLPKTVEMRDVTKEDALLMIVGPESDAVMQSLATPESWEQIGKIPSYSSASLQLGGGQVVVSRISYCGGDGYELLVPVAQGGATDLYNALLSTSAAKVTEIGYAACMTMRTEAARTCFTFDVPFGAPFLDCSPKFCAKLKPGTDDFVGKKAIMAAASKQMLLHLRADDPEYWVDGVLNMAAPAVGGEHRVLWQGHDVGYLTSASYGFRTDCSVMFALIQKRPDLGLTSKKAILSAAPGSLSITGKNGESVASVSLIQDAVKLIFGEPKTTDALDMLDQAEPQPAAHIQNAADLISGEGDMPRLNLQNASSAFSDKVNVPSLSPSLD